MIRLKPIQGVAFAIGVALGGLGYAQTGTVDTNKATAPDSAHPDRSAASSTDKSTTSRGSMRSDKSAKASDNLPRADRNFIEKMAQHNLAEIELGKVAEKNASSDEVKRFGREMVEDHTKANEELKKIADSKGVTLPTEPDRSHRRALDKMQKKTGADFDRDFVSDMVKDHKSDLKDFQKEARNAKDPDVKSFAEKNEATIQKHLDMAQQMENSTKVSSKGTERSSSTGASGSRSSSSAASGSTRSPSTTERSSGSSSSNR